MTDVCLLNPRTEKYKDINKLKPGNVYKDNILQYTEEFIREPPTGLMVLASLLEENGFSVEIIDCSIVKEPFEYIRKNAHNYRLLGITSLSNTFSMAARLAKTAKRFNPDIFIIMGGPHASFEYESILKENLFVDAVCVGESETSFPYLVNKLLQIPEIDLLYEQDSDDSGESNGSKKSNELKKSEKFKNRPGKIQQILKKDKKLPKGIALLSEPRLDYFLKNLNDYKPMDNVPDTLMSDINDVDSEIYYFGFPDSTDIKNLPLPARHLISMQYSVADVIVNRGCINQCSFCSRTKLFPIIRVRSIDDIMNELDQILTYNNYKFVNFYDNINMGSKYFTEFLEKLIDRKFPLPWGAELRADDITEEHAELLKKANCRLIATGVESANKNVLKINFKNQDPIKVANGIKLIKQQNIAVQAYFVVGLPGETNESFQQTLNYIRKLPLKRDVDKIEFFAITPYPGSDLALNPTKYGINILERNYSLYDCKEILMETPTLTSKEISAMYKRGKLFKKKMGL